jgi:hypothetical protein
MGYVARGPVFPEPDAAEVPAVRDWLKRAARLLGLRAMVVQCPDSATALDAGLRRYGFLPNRLRRIITATWITPVPLHKSQIDSRLRRTTRRTLKLAVRNGVSVRLGGPDDIGTFFELMRLSARRQGGEPNPASAEVLHEVWRAFGSGTRCRLTIAMHDGKPVSGLMCLLFGGIVHVWKKGSLPESLHLHPMEALYYDALSWAGSHRFAACDFQGMSRETAETFEPGSSFSREVTGSSDFFNIGFGGQPKLLLKPLLWVPNPLLRALYRFLLCNPVGSALLRKRYEWNHHER